MRSDTDCKTPPAAFRLVLLFCFRVCLLSLAAGGISEIILNHHSHSAASAATDATTGGTTGATPALAATKASAPAGICHRAELSFVYLLLICF